MELMAEPVGLVVAAAVTGYPPGVDPLECVGAGVGLGAGAGGEGGGASVGDGFGFGGDDVGWPAGCELVFPPLGAVELELADGEAAGLVEPWADADADALPEAVPAGVLPDFAVPLELWPEEVVLDVGPAALCAAVLANSVVSPKAVTTLSSVARQVSRDRRRSPESRLALKLRCLMGVTPSGLRLRAHQDRPSGLLPGDGDLARSGCQHEWQDADGSDCAKTHASDGQRPPRVNAVVDQQHWPGQLGDSRRDVIRDNEGVPNCAQPLRAVGLPAGRGRRGPGTSVAKRAEVRHPADLSDPAGEVTDKLRPGARRDASDRGRPVIPLPGSQDLDDSRDKVRRHRPVHEVGVAEHRAQPRPPAEIGEPAYGAAGQNRRI
jgi:hypothetical protein